MTVSLAALWVEYERSSSWRLDAACRGRDQRLWFPGRGDDFSIQIARAICRGCPVREQCLEYALDEQGVLGIWGGTTERQRRRLRVTPSA